MVGLAKRNRSIYALRFMSELDPLQPDSKIPSFKDISQAGSEPPMLPATEPTTIAAASPLVAASPPPLPPQPNRKSSRVEQTLAVLLSLGIGLFLADAVISLVDDSLILFFGIHFFKVLRGILFPFAMLMAILIYALIGLTPMIPKRFFLPLTLFDPVAGLLVLHRS